MPRHALPALMISLAGVTGTAWSATCAPKGTDPVDTVRQMYVDVAAGDRAKTLAAFDKDGYLFDGGARFTPEGITDLILKAEAAGTTPEWHVDGVERHVACDLAWATWNNAGTFTTKGVATPKRWVESAVFVWRQGAWKIRFFHSTPVAEAKTGGG